MSRSKAEKLEFAKACERIEKRGGDVLAYVEREYPSYTPRATWYMLQREYLNRKQLTEGRPKENRGEKDMGKMMDMANEVMDAYAMGESIYDWLEEHGYKNPSSMWFQMKQAAKKVDPDLYDRMCDAITSTKRKPKAQRTVEQLTPPPKPQEEPKEIPQAGEPMPVTVHGKRVTTCCAPARESGVTVPDELPEESLKIAALLSSFDPDFRYELSNIKNGKNRVVSLVWREPMGGGERSLNLTTDEWQLFAKEIPRMLKQLGLI